MPRARIPTAQPQARKPGSLLGLAEIAEQLGISKQRANQLVRRVGFPAPDDVLRMGVVWRAEPVEKWVREYRAAKPGGSAGSDTS